MLTPLWGVVVVIAASQVIATELTRYAQDGGFEAPFFVMWVHAALMSVLHPLSSCAGSTPPLSRKKINNSVWAFVVFYVGANYAYVRALEVAPASYVQTIFGTAPAAVTVLARFVLGERLSAQRCFAACGALAGATCLASPWAATTPKNTLLGLLLGEVAVANAALYKVMFARDYGSADSVFVSRFVGHVGIRVFLVGLPVVIALQWAGEEDRPTSRRWGLVVAGGCVDVVYNLAIAIALAIAPSPVYVAVATMLAIPATAVVDALANHLIPAWSEILGALLILASFATLVLEQRGQKTPDAGDHQLLATTENDRV